MNIIEHVIPAGNGEPLHAASLHCHCNPAEMPNGKVVHHSHDNRESKERQGYGRDGDSWLRINEVRETSKGYDIAINMLKEFQGDLEANLSSCVTAQKVMDDNADRKNLEVAIETMKLKLGKLRHFLQTEERTE